MEDLEKEIQKFYYLIAEYKPKNDNEEKVKILDKSFIKNNRNKCKIIYKNKKYELKEYFEDIEKNYNHKDKIKFKLMFIHNIIDLSYMFYNCNSLISLSDNNEANKKIIYPKMYIIKMQRLFYGCESLKSLPNIYKWDIYNANNMTQMFLGCKSLDSLPDFYILDKLKNTIFLKLTYKNNEKNKVKILGNEFVENNKDIGGIIYNNLEIQLQEYLEDIDNKKKVKSNWIYIWIKILKI